MRSNTRSRCSTCSSIRARMASLDGVFWKVILSCVFIWSLFASPCRLGFNARARRRVAASEAGPGDQSSSGEILFQVVAPELRRQGECRGRSPRLEGGEIAAGLVQRAAQGRARHTTRARAGHRDAEPE